MIQGINMILMNKLNFGIVKNFPRHSTRFAKEYFKDKKIIAIEIGTFMGYNAKSILKELNVKKLYIIDPYEEYLDYIESEPESDQQLLSKAEKIARKRLKDFEDKIVWIKEYSDKAIKEINNNIDFIYIDGNHEYPYVIKDMENYYKKLKYGGILAGHDIAGWTGVGKAFVEFCNKNKLKPNISRTDWWIIKK